MFSINDPFSVPGSNTGYHTAFTHLHLLVVFNSNSFLGFLHDLGMFLGLWLWTGSCEALKDYPTGGNCSGLKAGIYPSSVPTTVNVHTGHVVEVVSSNTALMWDTKSKPCKGRGIKLHLWWETKNFPTYVITITGAGDHCPPWTLPKAYLACLKSQNQSGTPMMAKPGRHVGRHRFWGGNAPCV